jgi:hypothetical protein
LVVGGWCSLPHTPYPILHTPYSIPHTPYPILLTPYSSPHTPHSILLTPYSSPHTPHSMLLTPCSVLRPPYACPCFGFIRLMRTVLFCLAGKYGFLVSVDTQWVGGFGREQSRNPYFSRSLYVCVRMSRMNHILCRTGWGRGGVAAARTSLLGRDLARPACPTSPLKKSS